MCHLLHLKRPLNPFENKTFIRCHLWMLLGGSTALPSAMCRGPWPCSTQITSQNVATLSGLIRMLLTLPQDLHSYPSQKCALLQGHTRSSGTSWITLHCAHYKSMIWNFCKYSTSLQQVPSGSSGKCSKSASLLNNDFWQWIQYL